MFGFAARFVGCLFIASMVNVSVAQTAAEEKSANAVSESEFPVTAHATVELVSEQMIGMLGDAAERYKQDPELVYADVDGIISPWLDFGRWSRAVMGSEYAEQATEDQLQKFEVAFRKSLVETYAKGLVSVEDAGYKIEPPKDGDEEKTSLWVRQSLHSGSIKVVVDYAMYKVDDGRWQVAEVELEGIKLRKTFQSQFKSAAVDSEGDLDTVIQNWGL